MNSPNQVTAYTCTFFSSTLVVTSSAGCSSTESAARAPTKKATVVKKPKTACARFRDECIVVGANEQPGLAARPRSAR